MIKLFSPVAFLIKVNCKLLQLLLGQAEENLRVGVGARGNGCVDHGRETRSHVRRRGRAQRTCEGHGDGAVLK